MNKQKTILITGFEPFGGETMNPAYEAVKCLPDEIEGYQIRKAEIPTAFLRSGECLQVLMEQHAPAAVICVGLAGGRAAMTVERVAINLMEAGIPDNAGFQPQDEPVRAEAPAAYFATIPVKAIVAAMREAGVPCHLSYTAGTYVCNSTMYELLDLCATRFPGVLGGFIHVPFATEQVLTKGASMASMELATITKGLEAALQAVIRVLEGADAAAEEKEVAGTIC